MKFIKLSVFALTMGLFIASCGNGESTTETTDTTVVVEPVAEVPVETAAPVDTMTAAPVDTAAAPATH